MRTPKIKQTDFDRIVSKILNKPPVDDIDNFDAEHYGYEIFGFDDDAFLTSQMDMVDPLSAEEEFEFDKIYQDYADFKKNYPKEAAEFFGWHPKGGEFIFNRRKNNSDYNGLMVKFRKKK